MAILIVFIVAFVALFLVLGYLIEFRFDFRRPDLSGLAGRRNFMRGCGPFELGSGDRAVMVIHGIAGSPWQMKELSERLASSDSVQSEGSYRARPGHSGDGGFHVYGVALPGHGTDPEDLYGITWQRWYEHVLAEYERIHERHGRVSVIGFSLGAALGLRLAMERPVERLVCISYSIKLFHDYLPSHWVLKLAGLFASTARTFPKRLPESEDGPEYMVYRSIPMDALNALVALVHESKPRLGEVKTPTLMVHSRRDPVAKPRGAQFIYDHLGSEEKRLVWLEDAPHGLMHSSDENKAILHGEITAFLSN